MLATTLARIATIRLQEVPTVVMATTIGTEAIPAFLARAYHDVAEHIEYHSGRISGPPFATYTPVGDDFRAFEIEAGFPVETAIPGGNSVVASTLPGGSAITLAHYGPFESMRSSYEATSSWLEAHNAVATGPAWEIYLSDPATQPDPATWRTDIVQPFRAT